MSRPGAAASWLRMQLRAAAIVALVLEVPLLGRLARLLTATPQLERDESVAGVPTTIARPSRGGPWPTLIFLNGVTARGRAHPSVVRLAETLARLGFVVLVPDLPGLARGELTEATLAATIDVVVASLERSEVRGRRAGLVGVSIGVSLGLAAAEQPGLAERVTVVAGIAPYVDFASVVRLATTGFTLERGQPVRYTPPPFMGLVVARSLIAGLPASEARRRLLDELLLVPDDDPDPLALLRRLGEEQLAPDTAAVVALCANRNLEQFDRLYAALPGSLRAGVERLSPLAGAAALLAPVELATAPHDTYLPLSEMRALASKAANTHVRLTLTSALDHAVPSFSLASLGGLVRFDGWVVRVLQAAARR